MNPALEMVMTSINSHSEKFKNLSLKVDNAILRIDDIEKWIVDLTARLEAAEGKINKLKYVDTSHPPIEINSLIRQYLSEMEQRFSRNNNIIIFGLPEKITDDASASKEIPMST